MPISLFNAANCYFHPPVLFAPFSSIIGCDRVGIAIPEWNDAIRIDPALLQDKVLYTLRPHPRKLQIVLIIAGAIGESGKDSKRIGVILKKICNQFQSVLTIERDFDAIKFELEHLWF